MKKFISLLVIAALLNPVGVSISIADFTDMQHQVETSLDIWVGGYFAETDKSTVPSFADNYSATVITMPETATRRASNKAAEYHSLDSSASGGFFFKDEHAPNRVHLEFDFNDEDDWFGDFRYSYKDYFLMRVLPRRLRHNLGNITLHDYFPNITGGNTGAADIEINDATIDTYGITMDIDEYRLRLKTPNFPLHLYTNGEIIKKKGTRQLRFLGGTGARSGSVGTRSLTRVSESEDVDTEKKEYSLGTNAHLGPVEFDISQTRRKFDSNSSDPVYTYDTRNPAAVPNTYESVHNTTPELEATTNTLKLHTSHSGRIFASTTFSEITKTNNTSNNEVSKVEAKNSLGYGELVWLPASYLSFTTKYRHQKNESNNTPTTTSAWSSATGPAVFKTDYVVEPGVESTIDVASLGIRYSQIPSTNFKVQFTNSIKEVTDESAITWSRPLKQTKNIYELDMTNWAIPKVRLTAKYRHTNIDHDFGQEIGVLAVTKDPEDSDHGNLGITWMISPKVAAFMSAIVTKEATDNNRTFDIDEYHDAEALRQQYLTSVTFMLSDKLSITPTYTYILDQQKGNVLYEDGNGHYVDNDYKGQQKAHNAALSIIVAPTKKLTINTTFDYTATEGNYEPSPSIIIASTTTYDPRLLGDFSYTKTQEYGVHMDAHYEIGQGWGLGVTLQSIDWQDDSFDNPSDSTYIGGLVKITKTIF